MSIAIGATRDHDVIERCVRYASAFHGDGFWWLTRLGEDARSIKGGIMKTTESFFRASHRQCAGHIATSARSRLATLIAGSSLMVIAVALAAHAKPANAADTSTQIAQAETGAHRTCSGPPVL